MGNMIKNILRSSLLVLASASSLACAGGTPPPTMTPEQAAIVLREGHPAEIKSLKKHCEFVDMADQFHGEMELRGLAVSKGANVAAIIVESETHMVVTTHTDTPNYHLVSTYHGAWNNASAVLFSCVADEAAV